MTKKPIQIIFRIFSDNRKSKIQNLKWGGIVAIGVAFAMCGAVAEAQQPKKVPRIGYVGYMSSLNPSTSEPRLEPFRQGLRDLGYIEGKNILVEYRYAEGKLARGPNPDLDGAFTLGFYWGIPPGYAGAWLH